MNIYYGNNEVLLPSSKVALERTILLLLYLLVYGHRLLAVAGNMKEIWFTGFFAFKSCENLQMEVALLPPLLPWVPSVGETCSSQKEQVPMVHFYYSDFNMTLFFYWNKQDHHWKIFQIICIPRTLLFLMCSLQYREKYWDIQ